MVTFIYTTPERHPTGIVIHHVRINASVVRPTEISAASRRVAPLSDNTDPVVRTAPTSRNDTRYVAMAPMPPVIRPVSVEDDGDKRQPMTPRINAEGTTIGSAKAGNKKLDSQSLFIP